MRHFQQWLFGPLLAASLGVACKDAAKEKGPAAQPAAAPVAELPKQIEVGNVLSAAKRTWLVPHPSEIQHALKESGVSSDLSAFLTPREPDFGPMDGPRVALNTGIVAAEIVLSLGTADKAQLVRQLKILGTGIKELGAPESQLKKVEQFAARIESGTLAGEGLLAEMDALQGALLDSADHYSSEDARVGVQAGAWLRAVNVFSLAIQKSGKSGEAGQLFRQPHVLDYFLDYFRRNAEKTAGVARFEGVIPAVEALRGVAAKPQLTDLDVTNIANTTTLIINRL